ncbi:MAG: YIP1 family protein [Pararhodobacter sp.]
MSVTRDILSSYYRPRSVVARLGGGPRREARALVYLMIACAMFFVAQWPVLSRRAHFDESIPLEGMMAGALFGWIFIAPLAFYGLGGVLTLALKLVRRTIDGGEVRLALFWALLVASPLALLHGLTTGMIGTGPATVLTFVLLVAVFLGVLVAGLRVALEAARLRA